MFLKTALLVLRKDFAIEIITACFADSAENVVAIHPNEHVDPASHHHREGNYQPPADPFPGLEWIRLQS